MTYYYKVPTNWNHTSSIVNDTLIVTTFKCLNCCCCYLYYIFKCLKAKIYSAWLNLILRARFEMIVLTIFDGYIIYIITIDRTTILIIYSNISTHLVSMEYSLRFLKLNTVTYPKVHKFWNPFFEICFHSTIKGTFIVLIPIKRRDPGD